MYGSFIAEAVLTGQRYEHSDQIYGLVFLQIDGFKYLLNICWVERISPTYYSLLLPVIRLWPQAYIPCLANTLRLPEPTLLGRQSSYLPSVVIHTYPCQSSLLLSGIIKLFFPNTYSVVSEWSPSKHSLLHFIIFLSLARVVAIWPSP